MNADQGPGRLGTGDRCSFSARSLRIHVCSGASRSAVSRPAVGTSSVFPHTASDSSGGVDLRPPITARPGMPCRPMPCVACRPRRVRRIPESAPVSSAQTGRRSGGCTRPCTGGCAGCRETAARSAPRSRSGRSGIDESQSPHRSNRETEARHRSALRRSEQGRAGCRAPNGRWPRRRRTCSRYDSGAASRRISV